ncbi:hypothetical protein V5799_027577 [Amblyomma americanum]|uniref:Uncharacterized protein n=1 Tax=Amblyomma americanum TaxID=6943 RepID=A0AAQ4DFC2_AMBAM
MEERYQDSSLPRREERLGKIWNLPDAAASSLCHFTRRQTVHHSVPLTTTSVCAFVGAGDSVYMVGGLSSDTKSGIRAVSCYRTGDNAFTPNLAPLPKALCGAAVVVLPPLALNVGADSEDGDKRRASSRGGGSDVETEQPPYPPDGLVPRRQKSSPETREIGPEIRLRLGEDPCGSFHSSEAPLQKLRDLSSD